MCMTDRSQLCLRIPPDAARLTGVRRRLSRYLRDQAVDAATADQIVLCVSEALNNAIQHSGTRAPVELEAGLCDGRVHIRVSDEGSGLGGLCIDPTHRAGLHQPTGRGFYLIWALMDEFEVTQQCGTTVRMVKRLDAAADAQIGSAGRSSCEDAEVAGGASRRPRLTPLSRLRRRRRPAA